LPGNQPEQSAVGDTELFTFKLHLSNQESLDNYQPQSYQSERQSRATPQAVAQMLP
jgi:hypothetical protein